MPNVPDGPTESSTERDGVFSYAGEFHSFLVGAGVGVATVTPSDRLRRFVWSAVGLDAKTTTDAMLEVKSESWYALGGMLFGMTFGLVVTALAFVLALGAALSV